MTDAVILAAGKGTRMKSNKPKVLHKIRGKSMIQHTIDNLGRSSVGRIIVVISDDQVAKETRGADFYVRSKKAEGTAYAAWDGILETETDNVAVLYGDDTFNYPPDIYDKILERHKKSNATITFITVRRDNPTGCGRVKRDFNKIRGIIEEKDASEAEKRITEVNDGVYIFKKDWFLKNVDKIDNNNAQKEYYLTDMIGMAAVQGRKISAYKLKDNKMWKGVNTKVQLKEANEKVVM